MVTIEDVNAARSAYLLDKPLYDSIGFSQEIVEEISCRFFANNYTTSRRDMLELFKAALRIPNKGTYCEVGSGWGGSLLLVHRATKLLNRNISLSTIDDKPQDKLYEVLEITKAKLYHGLSQEIHPEVPNNLDLLLIDGWHSYEQVCSDIENYIPKVKVGGMILLHDFDRESAHDPHWGVVCAVIDKLTEYTLIRPKLSSYIKVVKE